MKYDCVIIGGGIAGLTCAIKCSEAGLNCIVVSAGMSALHFASGSIDLLGRSSEGAIVKDPLHQLGHFMDQNPEHPYSKCGVERVSRSLSFFSAQLEQQSIRLCHNDARNHFHLTTYGTLTPTYLSQQSVYSPELEKAFFENSDVALISFEGFRDFHIPLVEANLPRHALFKDRNITTGTVELSSLITSGKNPHEFRSIDICRIFETEDGLRQIARQIERLSGKAEIVGIPACIGFIRHNDVYKRLHELTGKLI